MRALSDKGQPEQQISDAARKLNNLMAQMLYDHPEMFDHFPASKIEGSKTVFKDPTYQALWENLAAATWVPTRWQQEQQKQAEGRRLVAAMGEVII